MEERALTPRARAYARTGGEAGRLAEARRGGARRGRRQRAGLVAEGLKVSSQARSPARQRTRRSSAQRKSAWPRARARFKDASAPGLLQRGPHSGASRGAGLWAAAVPGAVGGAGTRGTLSRLTHERLPPPALTPACLLLAGIGMTWHKAPTLVPAQLCFSPCPPTPAPALSTGLEWAWGAAQEHHQALLSTPPLPSPPTPGCLGVTGP